MRIIGGIHGGRRLGSLSGSHTRPTGERVREALFNIWQTHVDQAVFWDAYAGTGAVGLEAYSRGAARVVFSEVRRDALSTLRHNIALVGAQSHTQVWAMRVEDLLAQWADQGVGFDLVFLDPPWQTGISEFVAHQIVDVVKPLGMAVLESRQDKPIPGLAKMDQLWTRRYGDTRLTAFSPIIVE